MSKQQAKTGEINIGIGSKDREAITKGLSHRLDIHEVTAWTLRASLED